VTVRPVRGGLALLIDGTLASFQRQDRAVTGPVWWALAAPIVALRRRRRRVLLLGLGGGSVARALRLLDPTAEIVGVENDPRVIQLGRRHFGMGRLGVEVIAADALQYLKANRRRYDLIVEDLFVGSYRSGRKPKGVLGDGHRLMCDRLRPGGILVSNTIHETKAELAGMRVAGGHTLSLQIRGHWNRIVVSGDVPEATAFRRLMKGHAGLRHLLSHVAVRSH